MSAPINIPERLINPPPNSASHEEDSYANGNFQPITARRAPQSYTGQHARRLILTISTSGRGFIEQYNELDTMYHNPGMNITDLYIILGRQRRLLNFSEQVQRRRSAASRASLYSRSIEYISRIPRPVSRNAAPLEVEEQPTGNNVLRRMSWPVRYNDPYDELVG